MRNTRIEGVRFGLFDNCGRQIASGCTNRNGEIDFEGLPMGRYIIKQLTRTGGFDASCECREVVIDQCGRCRTVEFENVQRLGGIRVQLFGRTDRCSFDEARQCGCAGSNARSQQDSHGESRSESGDNTWNQNGQSMRSDCNGNLWNNGQRSW